MNNIILIIAVIVIVGGIIEYLISRKLRSMIVVLLEIHFYVQEFYSSLILLGQNLKKEDIIKHFETLDKKENE